MFNLRDIVAVTKGVLHPGVIPKRFSGVSIDSRSIKSGELFVAIVGERFDGHDFVQAAVRAGAKGVIYSQDSKIKKIEKNVAYIKVADTLEALGAIAQFNRRRFDIPVIAVTGTSGKTTTKEMIAWVLSAKFNVLKNKGTQNNQIGVPLTLLQIHSRHDLCVLEMGTNRVGEIKTLAKIAQANVGVVTNIGPAHLEFLGTLKGVYREKIELIRHLYPPGIVLLNKGDIVLSPLSRVRRKPFIFFGINRDCDLKATEIVYHQQSISFLFNGVHSFEVRHQALHNASNALAAIGCALVFGLDLETVRHRLKTFDSPAMRLKEIKLGRCVIFDDSYNSNPPSLKQAIDVLCRQMTEGRKILVMGDMLELGTESEAFHLYFGRYISRKTIDLLITFGNFSKVTGEAACRGGVDAARIVHFQKIERLIDFLCEQIREGDCVLVKGSRVLRMERIITSLKKRLK